jgi:acyl transferase domain-containing protein/acyl carrier protein
VLAAADPDELRAQARALRARVAATSVEGLADLASSVAGRVAALPYRAVVLTDRREEVLRGLDGLQHGGAGAGVVCGRAREGARVAFVFSPLRAEYAGMGLDLLDRYEAFAAQMAACEAALAPFVEWSLDDILHGRDGTPPFERLDVSQPVLFAISFSLAELWRSFGAHPDAVLGHSVGEIAAAATCRGLSLTDAARVAATWGRSSMRLEGTGTMASLPLSAKEVERRIEPWRGRLAISGLNAPSWTAVTGETAAVEALLAELASDGIAGRPMGIEAPGHSAAMAPIHDWFLDELATISPRSGTVPFCSASEGRLVDSAGLDASYWSRNLSQPVLFEAAIHALRKAAYDVFVEIGPRPVLTSAISEIVAAEDEAVAVGTWEQGEASQFPLQLAEAYVLGVEVDWGAMCRNRRADVPPAALRLSERERSLALGLAELPEKKREPLLLDLVRREVATALGHASPDAVDPERSFKDLGFDSPAAVDLRNRLNRATGLSLSTTLAFDHPTPRAVARKIRFEFEGYGGASPAPGEDAAPDADTERALRDIDELDLAGLVERGLTDVDGSARARRGS